MDTHELSKSGNDTYECGLQAVPEHAAFEEKHKITDGSQPGEEQGEMVEEEKGLRKKRLTEDSVRIITNVVITIFSTAALLSSIAIGMRGRRRS